MGTRPASLVSPKPCRANALTGKKAALLPTPVGRVGDTPTYFNASKRACDANCEQAETTACQSILSKRSDKFGIFPLKGRKRTYLGTQGVVVRVFLLEDVLESLE